MELRNTCLQVDNVLAHPSNRFLLHQFPLNFFGSRWLSLTRSTWNCRLLHRKQTTTIGKSVNLFLLNTWDSSTEMRKRKRKKKTSCDGGLGTITSEIKTAEAKPTLGQNVFFRVLTVSAVDGALFEQGYRNPTTGCSCLTPGDTKKSQASAMGKGIFMRFRSQQHVVFQPFVHSRSKTLVSHFEPLRLIAGVEVFQGVLSRLLTESRPPGCFTRLASRHRFAFVLRLLCHGFLAAFLDCVTRHSVVRSCFLRHALSDCGGGNMRGFFFSFFQEGSRRCQERPRKICLANLSRNEKVANRTGQKEKKMKRT